MDQGLVMITGSSPGVGKTSVSALLQQQLRAHRIRSEWWHEERLESALRDRMPGWHVDLGDPEVFLAGCRDFVRTHGGAEAVLVTASVLPGYLDLFGRRSPGELAGFNRDLHETLAPLRPLLVYLHCDVETALARAVRQRGEGWLESIRGYLNTWRLPRYAARGEPFATADDVTAYFTALDGASRRLVEAWPGASLLLSAEAMEPEDLARAILRFAALDWLPIPATPAFDPDRSWADTRSGTAVPPLRGWSST